MAPSSDFLYATSHGVYKHARVREINMNSRHDLGSTQVGIDSGEVIVFACATQNLSGPKGSNVFAAIARQDSQEQLGK